jgi:hypothetical protein
MCNDGFEEFELKEDNFSEPLSWNFNFLLFRPNKREIYKCTITRPLAFSEVLQRIVEIKYYVNIT